MLFLTYDLDAENLQFQELLAESLPIRVGPNMRVSPVFPVKLDVRPPLQINGRWHLGFFCLANPAEQIGKILEVGSPGLAEKIFFTHGLASLLALTQDRSEIDEIRRLTRQDLFAAEYWELEDGILKGSQVHPPRRVAALPEGLKITSVEGLTSDLQALLVEFWCCIQTALQRSAAFAPSMISTFVAHLHVVNDIIYELRFLGDLEAEAPVTMDSKMVALLKGDPVAQQKRRNQRTDQLVQLNSSLSYVISQAFAGSLPILRHESQVRTYSLLGVGSAELAISRFSQHVMSQFGGFPIHEAIEERFPYAAGIEVFPSLADYDQSLWRSAGLGLDKLMEGLKPQPHRPKLVFFSGRLGFKETEFSVAAAIQVLSAADSSRWSLMTLTHELMHAHVRAILGTVLRVSPGASWDTLFASDYARLEGLLGDGNIQLSLAQSLRLVIINHSLQKHAYERIAWNLREGSPDAESNDEIHLPNLDTVTRFLREDYRDVNEIMTHTLDFHYFYNGRADTYIGLLWESWSTVPSVLDEVGHYILRTLVTIATSELGSFSRRFDAVCATFQSQLRRLVAQGNRSPVLDAAIHFVDDELNRRVLLYRFCPAVYLADATFLHLHSRQIHAALVKGDPRLDLEAAHYIYDLDLCAFPRDRIVTPVGFLVDRLRRALLDVENQNSNDIEYNIDHRSAWLLLQMVGAP